MKVTRYFLLVSTALWSVASLAAEPESFDLDVSRAQGSLSCLFSKANSGTLDCKSQLKGQGKLNIKMTLNEQGKKGFYGMDKIKEGDSDFILVVGADGDKNTKAIVLLQGQSSDRAVFEGSLTVTEASALMALNVSPIHIERAENESIRVNLTFVAYGPAKSFDPSSEQGRKALVSQIVEKIRPAVMAFEK